ADQASRGSLALDNGQAIAAHVYEPEGTPRASAIVSCAMGVTQRFYSLFAQWLASQGYRAITFDYRGIGLSAPRSLRGFEVDVIGWARQDCAAAINYAREKLPGKPLYWIRSEEHTSELQSRENLVCRLLLEKKKKKTR